MQHINRDASPHRVAKLKFSDMKPYLGSSKCIKAEIAELYVEACHVFFNKLLYSQKIEAANDSFNITIQRFYEKAVQNDDLRNSVLCIKNESTEIWRKIVKIRGLLLEHGIYVEILQNEVGIIVDGTDFKINNRPFHLYCGPKLTEAHGITVNDEYVALSLTNAVYKAIKMEERRSEFLRFIRIDDTSELLNELIQLYVSSTAAHEAAHLLRKLNGTAGKNEKYEEKIAYLYQLAYGPLSIGYEAFPLVILIATRTETVHEVAQYEIMHELVRKLGLDKIWDSEERRQTIERRIESDPDLLSKLAKEILDYELGQSHERAIDIGQLKRAAEYRFIGQEHFALIKYVSGFRFV